jgi:nitroreductase
MEFLELTKKRYSVRKYLLQEVESEKLEIIFEAARFAPSAANFQPVRYYVLDSKDAKENIAKITKYAFNAPLWILVAYDAQVSWKNKYTSEDKGNVDCAIAITHMMLAATSLGLGTCWVGSFDGELAKKLYHLPNNIEPVALLPLGYPDLSVPSNPLHTQRNSISEHIFKI